VTTALERATEPAPPQPTRARASRDPFFDNAKLLLVTFVVVGHSWTLMDENYVSDRLYNWLYMWHIPAFVMLTGYLSRSFTWSRRHLHKLVTSVLLPYLVFEGLLALFRVQVGGEKLERLWLNPHWPMWYLAALFLWRLATPLLKRLPAAIPLTVAVSLVAGTVAMETFDANRVLGLLPFFTLGLVAAPEHVARLRLRPVRLAAVAVLLAGVAVAVFVESQLHTEWLYFRRSYAQLDVGWPLGMLIRLGVIAVGAAMAFAVLAWIPSRTTWYSRLGTSSLVVYLFHAFFVKGAEYAGLEDWAQGRAWESLVVTTVGALAVAMLLAWRPVARTLDTVVVPEAHLPTPGPGAAAGRDGRDR
jgi:fucose 4-O-acetylase-like acetyltransferase